jgi:hypothetical protein
MAQRSILVVDTHVGGHRALPLFIDEQYCFHVYPLIGQSRFSHVAHVLALSTVFNVVAQSGSGNP